MRIIIAVVMIATLLERHLSFIHFSWFNWCQRHLWFPNASTQSAHSLKLTTLVEYNFFLAWITLEISLLLQCLSSASSEIWTVSKWRPARSDAFNGDSCREEWEHFMASTFHCSLGRFMRSLDCKSQPESQTTHRGCDVDRQRETKLATQYHYLSGYDDERGLYEKFGYQRQSCLAHFPGERPTSSLKYFSPCVHVGKETLTDSLPFPVNEY